MKKHLRSRRSPESVHKNALRLSQETLKVLTSDQLTQAVSGCLSTSWTTQSDPSTDLCA